MFINLLPQKTRLKNQYYRLLSSYLKVWSIAGVVALSLIAFQLRNFCEARYRLNLLAVRCQPLNSLQQQLSDSHQRKLKLQIEVNMLEQLQPTDHSIELLSVLVREMRSETGRLRLQRLSLQRALALMAAGNTTGPKNATAAKSTAQFTNTLSLQGVADDDAAVAKFVSGLRDSRVFERVDLKSSTQGVASGRTTRHYQLECLYEDKP